MNKTLILITSDFPFGLYETFIENEIKHLCDEFSSVVIISRATDISFKRDTPNNCKTYNYIPPKYTFIKKLLSFKLLFNSNFLHEISFINKTYDLKISKKVIQIILKSLSNAILLQNFIDSIIRQNGINTENTYLYSYWLDDAAIAIALFKKKHINTIAFSRAHNWDIYYERYKPNYLPLRSLIFDELNAIYFVSENGYKYSIKKFNDKEIFKISRIGVNENQENYIRQKKRIDSLTILTCSYIIPIKRLELLILALNNINDIKIKWVHIGEGIINPMYIRNLKQFAKEQLENKHNIEYNFIGSLSNKEVIKFYKENQIDVLVNLSEYEGLPVSLMEAASFGIPLIATDVGGNCEIVKNNFNGFLLYAQPKVDEVIEKIKDLYNLSEPTYLNFCKNSYNIWESNFNAKKNFQDFITKIKLLRS